MKRFTKRFLAAAGLFLLPVILMAQSPAQKSAESQQAADPDRKNPEEVFKRNDKNNDGFLTSDEARDPERFKRMLDRADNSPRDGKISKEEFARARAAEANGEPSQRASVGPSAGKSEHPAVAASAEGARKDPEEIFSRIDKNHDGFLTSEEARNPERFKRLLQRADNAPKDGKISREEFVKSRRDQSNR